MHASGQSIVREYQVEKQYLNLPVDMKQERQMVTFSVGARHDHILGHPYRGRQARLLGFQRHFTLEREDAEGCVQPPGKGD